MLTPAPTPVPIKPFKPIFKMSCSTTRTFWQKLRLHSGGLLLFGIAIIRFGGWSGGGIGAEKRREKLIRLTGDHSRPLISEGNCARACFVNTGMPNAPNSMRLDILASWAQLLKKFPHIRDLSPLRALVRSYLKFQSNSLCCRPWGLKKDWWDHSSLMMCC